MKEYMKLSEMNFEDIEIGLEVINQKNVEGKISNLLPNVSYFNNNYNLVCIDWENGTYSNQFHKTAEDVRIKQINPVESETVWVLTEEHNLYDQNGKYFIAVFKEKPTTEQLLALNISQEQLIHVKNGGGRVDSENQWFNLEQEKLK